MKDQTRINQLLGEYAQSHQNPTNIAIHKVCVPAITFSVVGLIYSLPVSLGEIHFIYWVLLAVVLYYARLSLKYLVIFLPILVLFVWLADFLKNSQILWQTSLGVFIIAWIGQFYGHKIEGKKPSFFKDLQFLLIGPLWTIKTVLKLEDQ